MPRRTSPSRNTDQPTAHALKTAKKLLKSCPTHSRGGRAHSGTLCPAARGAGRRSAEFVCATAATRAARCAKRTWLGRQQFSRLSRLFPATGAA